MPVFLLLLQWSLFFSSGFKIPLLYLILYLMQLVPLFLKYHLYGGTGLHISMKVSFSVFHNPFISEMIYDSDWAN